MNFCSKIILLSENYYMDRNSIFRLELDFLDDIFSKAKINFRLELEFFETQFFGSNWTLWRT